MSKSKKKNASAARRTPKTPKASAKVPSPWARPENQNRPARPALTIGAASHGDHELHTRLVIDIENAVRYVLARSAVLQRIRDSQEGQPGAQSFDKAEGAGEFWCFQHQRGDEHEITWTDELGERRRKPCPARVRWVQRSDMPGEAAVHPDTARRHEDQERKALNRLHAVVEELTLLAMLYVRRAPNEADRLALDRANRPAEPGCGCCQEVGVWSPPVMKNPTTVKGLLSEPVLLCRWCWDQVRRFERLPTADEVAQHHDPSVTKVKMRVSETESVYVP